MHRKLENENERVSERGHRGGECRESDRVRMRENKGMKNAERMRMRMERKECTRKKKHERG